MSQSPVISVVVPVYNAENYLRRCIDSILSQTNADFELILVDDGSSDRSIEICDSYPDKDARVLTIHQANRGQAAARNAGIQRAHGEYIVFLDSDDYWICDNALSEMESLLHEHSETDVVLFGYVKHWVDKCITVRKPVGTVMDTLADAAQMIETGTYGNSACNKLIRRAWLLDHALLFREGYLCEDVEWCGKLLRLAPEIRTYNAFVMVYEVKRNTSSKPKQKAYDDLLALMKAELEFVRDLDNRLLQTTCYAYWAYQMSWFLGYPVQIGPECFTRAKEELKAYLFLFRYAKDRKAKLVRLSLRLCGLGLTMRLLAKKIKI